MALLGSPIEKNLGRIPSPTGLKNNGKKMFYTWHKSARPMSFAWLLVAAAYLMSHTISADNSSIVSHVSCHKLFRIHHQRRYWTCSPYLICFICLSNLCSSTKVCLSHYLFAIPPNLSLQSTKQQYQDRGKWEKREREGVDMALEFCAFFCPFKTKQNLFFISIMARMTFHCNIGSLFIILFKLALKQTVKQDT